MSKLSDRIKQSGKVEPAPIGFATSTSRTASASMLTAVDTGVDAGKIADHVKKGADVVIWQGDAAALRKAKLPDGVILGVVAANAGREEAAALREAGADFLVIDADARGEALLDDKLGFVMTISDPSALEDAQLRLMGELNLDAILVEAPGAPMSVGDVLDLRRVAALARAPLVLRAAPGIDVGTLQLLRESGAIGVALEGAGATKLAELRKTIETLPERGRKGADKSEALVPASTSAGSHDHDDDDDYDD